MTLSKSLLSILALAVVCGGWPTVALSQDARPQLYLVADFLIDVSRAGEYETAVKELLAEWKKLDFPYRLDTFGTDDGHCYGVVALNSFGEVDALNEAWRALERKMGAGRLASLHERIRACEIERIFRFWTFRPDISYLPKPERLRSEEIGYCTWDFVWIIPGKEAEFEARNKDWISLSGVKQARDPFLTYQGGPGTTMPVYVWLEYGKSAADYAVAEDGFWKTLGDAGAALSKRTRAVIRRMESKTGRYRPDLSYDPKK